MINWRWTERELQQECLQVGLHGAVRYVLYAFSEVILEALEVLFPELRREVLLNKIWLIGRKSQSAWVVPIVHDNSSGSCWKQKGQTIEKREVREARGLL
jgi:hypothetical protein